jgi:hypothetical protein
MRTILAAFACVIGLGVADSAYAHHSMNGFDRTKQTVLVGTVKQFKWANPHSWIEIEVPNKDKGVVETWNVEMTAPGILARAGWKSNTVKPGDKVSIAVYAMTTGDLGGLFVSLTLADGRTLTERAPAVAATKQ